MKTNLVGNVGGGVVYAAALGWALWFIGVFVVVALLRAGFDFDLEWMEGLMLEQTRRVMDGRSLYPSPSAEYVPSPYPPLYFYISALFSYVLGAGYLPLRIVSALSTLASCGALYAFVRRESGCKLPGLVAAGLFAATWKINAYWLDLARVDMLSMALILWAAYFVRFSSRLWHDLLAALLVVASGLSKQSAALPAAGLFIWMLLSHRRALPGFVVGGLIIGLSALAALYAVYGEWLYYYLLKVPASHGIIDHRIGMFWKTDWLQPFGLATVAALWYFFRRGDRSGEKPGGTLFYLIFALACLVASFLGRIKIGGAYNAMIPLHSAIALLCGLSLAAASGCADGRLRGFLSAVCIMQFIFLAYNPARFIPSAQVENALRGTQRILAAIPGETYVMRSPNINYSPGKPGMAHMCAAEDMLKEKQLFRANRKAILDPFINQKYYAVAINPRNIPDYCRRVFLENYEATQRRVEILLWQDETGFTLNSEVVYLAKDRIVPDVLRVDK